MEIRLEWLRIRNREHSADFRWAPSDGFRQSWMSFDGFTCNEPSCGLAEEWPNF